MIAYYVKLNTGSGINYNSEPKFVDTDSIETENRMFREIMSKDETLKGLSILAGDTITFCREEGNNAEFMFNENSEKMEWNVL